MESSVVAQVIREHAGGKTQTEIAELSGVSMATISAILNGHKDRVTLRTLHKLALGLGIAVSEFTRREVTA